MNWIKIMMKVKEKDITAPSTYHTRFVFVESSEGELLRVFKCPASWAKSLNDALSTGINLNEFS